MSGKKRKPFHEVLADILKRDDLTILSSIEVIRIFAENALIPGKHDKIAEGARWQKRNFSHDAGAIQDLCVIESAAQNEQRREAEKQKERTEQLAEASEHTSRTMERAELLSTKMEMLTDVLRAIRAAFPRLNRGGNFDVVLRRGEQTLAACTIEELKAIK